MAKSPSDKSTWSLHGTVAELDSSQLSARVDVARPDLGAQQVQWSGINLLGHLLAVGRDDDAAQRTSAWPLSLADAYARGDDLIASYSPRDAWPFSPQIYWRSSILSRESPSALSLLVSVQTHLLDTRPCIRVGSRLEAAEVLLVQLDNEQEETITVRGRADFSPTAYASIVVARLAAADFSYIEMMPASDFRKAAVHYSADGVCQTRWSLFADFLEKGVIWRARLTSLLVPRANDVELATRICRALDERPLPLTV